MHHDILTESSRVEIQGKEKALSALKDAIEKQKEGSAAKPLLEENTKGGTIQQAPFVTDTNAWTKLGLKTALKEAVKQGAERIAWTTGEQQNDRYDKNRTTAKGCG